MKKNRMMRLASILLVATLMSTCTISGTFAKYVTTGSATDSARVAKWGVEIDTWAYDDPATSLFSKTYAQKADPSKLAVESSTTHKLVAPGTENTNGVVFSITGTPEVAVKLDIAMTGTKEEGGKLVADTSKGIKDVYLPAGNHKDWTQAPYSGKFAIDDYYPVVYTLTYGTTTVEGNLAVIEEHLENVMSGEYAPNTDLGTDIGVCTLTWEWAFEGAKTLTYAETGTPEPGDTYAVTFGDPVVVDQADTLLGQIAAEKDTVANASTDIDFAISITATQID